MTAIPDHDPAPGSPPAIYLGWLAFLAGAIAVGAGFAMPTTVETSGIYGSVSRVVNLDLVRQQGLVIQSGMLLLVVGTLVLVLGYLLKYSPLWQAKDALDTRTRAEGQRRHRLTREEWQQTYNPSPPVDVEGGLKD